MCSKNDCTVLISYQNDNYYRTKSLTNYYLHQLCLTLNKNVKIGGYEIILKYRIPHEIASGGVVILIKNSFLGGGSIN